MEAEKITQKKQETGQETGIKGIFFFMDLILKEVSDELERSEALYAIGEKTELSVLVEQAILNPADSISELQNPIDEQVKEIIHTSVKRFLSAAFVVQEAYKSFTEELHYCLVLKEDTYESREIIFEFLEEYEKRPVAKRHPIAFQFIPATATSKIRAEKAKI